MASVVELCNLALSHLGSYVITSLSNPTTQEQRKCNIYYAPARDFVLRAFPWNFAEKRAYLAELGSGETKVGYEYAYEYPQDCLKARDIYNSTSGGDPIDFIINSLDSLTGKKVLTDQATALLIYTAKVTDPNVFDALFNTAFSFKLASDLAIPLTKNVKLRDAMLNAYISYMGTARTGNASEAKDTTEKTNPYITARS